MVGCAINFLFFSLLLLVSHKFLVGFRFPPYLFISLWLIAYIKVDDALVVSFFLFFFFHFRISIPPKQQPCSCSPVFDLHLQLFSHNLRFSHGNKLNFHQSPENAPNLIESSRYGIIHCCSFMMMNVESSLWFHVYFHIF